MIMMMMMIIYMYIYIYMYSDDEIFLPWRGGTTHECFGGFGEQIIWCVFKLISHIMFGCSIAHLISLG